MTLCVALWGGAALGVERPVLSRTPAPAADPAPPTQAQLDRALLLATLAGDVLDALGALSLGANPNARDSHGNSPLDYAAYFGHSDLFELLVQQKADVFAPSHLAWDHRGTGVSTHLAATQARRLGDRLWQSQSAWMTAQGVGEVWPYRGVMEREPYRNHWPAAAWGHKTPTPAETIWRTPGLAAHPSPVVTTREAAPTPAPAPACGPLSTQEKDGVAQWCERIARKVKSACLVADCEGSFRLEGGLTCQTCVGGANKSVAASPENKWEMKAGAIPLAPAADLRHFSAVCLPLADAPSFCDATAGSYRAILSLQARKCLELSACEGMDYP